MHQELEEMATTEMHRTDADGDGTISQAELVAEIHRTDADGDGTISRAEFVAGGGEKSDFEQLDWDGSGSLSGGSDQRRHTICGQPVYVISPLPCLEFSLIVRQAGQPKPFLNSHPLMKLIGKIQHAGLNVTPVSRKYLSNEGTLPYDWSRAV